MFAKWMAQQSKDKLRPKPDPIAMKIEEVLAEYASDRSFRLGNYGYKIKRVRGKRSSGFVVIKQRETKIRKRRNPRDYEKVVIIDSSAILLHANGSLLHG